MPRDYRINRRIRIPEVRLVDEKGEQVGVIATHEALKIAEERGLDLVEVAPAATPPVCRLMDYGKFRYETARREREARKTRKTKASNEVREVRFRTRIGEHDRSAKTRLIKRLLDGGAKVKVSVVFRGREIEHAELGMTLLKTVAEALVDDALLERPPGFEGRMLTMTLTPQTRTVHQARSTPDEAKMEEAKIAKDQDP